VAVQGGGGSSLLGTALATTNDTALQPQGIGPDNPRADTKLTHSLVAFQHVGDSSEAFVSSCSPCSSSFSCPLILPPVIRHGKRAKHPEKDNRSNALQKLVQFFIRVVHVEFVNETIRAPDPADDSWDTYDALNQPHMLDSEERSSLHLVRHLALLALQLESHYPPFKSTVPQCHRWRGKVTTFGVVRYVQY
jgi:hypothetical protein